MDFLFYSLVYETLNHKKYVINTITKYGAKEKLGPLSRIDRGTTQFDSKEALANYLYEKQLIPNTNGIFYIVRTGTKRTKYFDVQYSENQNLNAIANIFSDLDYLYENNENYLNFIDFLHQATDCFFESEDYRKLFSKFKQGSKVLQSYESLPDYINVMKKMEEVLVKYENIRTLLIESKKLESKQKNYCRQMK